MKGLGTILNVLCILIGGVFGLLFGKKIKKQLQETLLMLSGIVILFIGISTTLQYMFVIENNQLQTQGTMMMLVSLILGAVIGEWIDIDARIEHFGQWLKEKSNSSNDKEFVNAFVVASCTVCIGAMAVVGSVQDGLVGNYMILFSKGIIDAIIICVMSASLGKGCVFSAIPVLLFQGSITLLTIFIGPLISVQALSNLSLVGAILITCVGINLIWDKNIRVANLLPSLVIAVLWSII